MLLYLQVAVRKHEFDGDRLLLVESPLDQCQLWSSGFVGDGIWAYVPIEGLDQVKSIPVSIAYTVVIH